MSYTPLTLTCADNFINNTGLTLARQHDHLVNYLSVPIVKAVTDLTNAIIAKFQTTIISGQLIISTPGQATATLQLSSSLALSAGDTVTITGSDNPLFNGQFVLDNVSGSTITYTISANTVVVTSTANGQVSVPMPNFNAIGQTTFPGLTNAMPVNAGILQASATLPAQQDGFAGYVLRLPTPVYNTGEYSIISSVWSQASGYVSSINEVIKSALQSKVKDSTFISHDAAMTSNLSAITSDIPAFVTDLKKTSELFNDPGSKLGYENPARLYRKIVSAQASLKLQTAIETQGITRQEQDSLLQDSKILPATLSKLYNAFDRVTGSDLTFILEMLDITTAGIVKLSDLMDLRIMLPQSIASVMAPTKTSRVHLYVTGQTNIARSELLHTTQTVIPEEQAILLLAFSSSMQQIKNIANLDIATIVQAGEQIITTATKLPLLSTTAMSLSAKESLNTTFAIGTGPDNTLVQADVLGTSIGYVHGELFDQLATQIRQVTSVSTLMQILTDAHTVVQSASSAIVESQLVSYYTQAVAEVNAIAAANPAVVTAANIITGKLARRILNESRHQVAALINLSTMRPSVMGSMEYAKALHNIALDLGEGNQRMIMDQLANIATASGQTVVACMDEGSNIDALRKTGLATDNFIEL